MAVVGLVLSISSYSNAALIININENGGNVEASFSGSINISALQGQLSGGSPNALSGFAGGLGAVGFTNGAIEGYAIDAARWTPFGTGFAFMPWDTSMGDALVLFPNPVLALPSGYITNSAISGTATKFSSTLASLGFTVGTFVTTLSNGNFTDSIEINITQVPEPSTLAVFALGLMGLASRRFKSKSR